MRTRRHGLALLLAGLVAADASPQFAQELNVQVQAPEPAAEPPSAAAPAVSPATSPNPLAGLDLEALSATRELPLFTPSRTAPVVDAPIAFEPPAPEPQPEAPPEDLEPPPLRLIGVVMTASEQVAILADEATGAVQRLRPGETYEDWTLRIVDTRTIAFENGEERETYTMFEPGSDPNFVPGAKTPVPEEALREGVEFGPDGQPIPGSFNEDTEAETFTETPPPEEGSDAEGEEQLMDESGESSEEAAEPQPGGAGEATGDGEAQGEEPTEF